MSTHDDNARDAGLTPEERALARRLAKVGPQGEPSPALDAHILAAAHDAVRPVQPRRKASKWPATMGFAASLAIACGIAWQLRPVPNLPRSEATQAVLHEEGVEYRAPAPAMSAADVPRRQLNMPTPPPAEVQAPRQRAKIRAATRADEQQKPHAFAIDSPIVLDEAVHPAPPAAPAPPPPPPAPMQAMERAAAASAPASAAGVAPQAARERAEPEFAEPDEEVVPPATTESPAVRDAWLQRIRELVRDGHVDAARESLKAFRNRYPGHAIPDDLHAIEE
jgi:hypothetical protein